MAKLVRVDRGNWANNTDYLPGDYALDVPSSVIWNCAVMHTSAAAGTFADDRAANPTYWRVALQVIASADKYKYDGTITPLMPNNVIRGRYPWRIPQLQEGGSKVSVNQGEQRTRWKAIQVKFKTLSPTTKQRWYDAAPIWHSLLFYYNYFMMSGLMGNAVVGDKGSGVIKSIQHKTFSMTAGSAAPITVSIDAVDPSKAVVFFYGAGVNIPDPGVAVPNYPFLVSLASTQAIFQASLYNEVAAGCSVSIIEYI